MLGWFFNKKRLERLEKDTKKGFKSVKNDFLAVNQWISHLNKENDKKNEEIKNILKDISSIKETLEELQNSMNLFLESPLNMEKNRLFTTTNSPINKQTGVEDVQTAVQTAVQTPDLSNFSMSEKKLILILLNDDRNLSHEDLAKLTNKTKSTIRGQINSIKSKSESLISEIIEENGKKRVYIPKKIKEKLLKKQKVRVK